jgi:hypothetical protein
LHPHLHLSCDPAPACATVALCHPIDLYGFPITICRCTRYTYRGWPPTYPTIGIAAAAEPTRADLWKSAGESTAVKYQGPFPLLCRFAPSFCFLCLCGHALPVFPGSPSVWEQNKRLFFFNFLALFRKILLALFQKILTCVSVWKDFKKWTSSSVP